jgi:hypothetical protein
MRLSEGIMVRESEMNLHALHPLRTFFPIPWALHVAVGSNASIQGAQGIRANESVINV